MRTKDTILLEQAYQIVHEAKTPCPCTVGKKCKNEKCTCTACKKSKKKVVKEMHEDGNPVDKEKSLNDPIIQKGMAILQAYAQEEMSNLQAAEAFDDLYKNGPNAGPTQDDQYYTHTDTAAAKGV